MAALVLAVLVSCKKKNEDPSPSSSGGSHYRVASIHTNEAGKNSNTTYTYNVNGKIEQEQTTDSVGAQTYKSNLQYNSDGLISFYSESINTYNGSYAVSYNTDKLVTKIIEYSDLTGTTVAATTVYYYNTNKDLLYTVKTRTQGSNIIKDSTSYSNYTNGRPGIQRTYSNYGATDYTFSKKQRYTYDARMNRIMEESANSSDSTVFYTSYTATFTILGGKQAAAWLDLNTNLSSNIFNDNPSYGNRDNDVDFINEYSSAYSACGIGSKHTETIPEENEAGYPLSIKDIRGSYNCGLLNNNQTVIGTITYEMY